MHLYLFCNKSHYENVPFEIPESWCWTTLGELFDLVSAKRVLQSDWQRTGIPFYRAREIVRLSYEGYVDNDLFITEEHYNNLKKSYGVPEPSDIMLSAVGTIGRAYVVRNNDVFYYKDASVLCLRNVYHLNSEFIKWILSSDLLQNQMYENSKGTTVDTITIEKANSYFLPLPPIDEQYRIVKLLCEWDAYINDINKNKEEVLNNIRTCKSKILDLAISGKLVSQDPNDEPAIELLKRINPNFKPCDNSHYENLPQGWAVCRLSDMVRIQNGFAFQSAKYIDVGIRIIRITNVQSGYIIDESPKFYPHNLMVGLDEYNLKNGDLLMSLTGNVGRVGIMPENLLPAALNQRVCCIKPKNNDIDKMYLFYYFQAEQFIQDCIASGKGVAQLNVSTEWLKHYIIQLPPKEEQSRIVKTIDALFSIIDKITAEL